MQKLLGHRDMMTTMIYTRVLNRGPSGIRSTTLEVFPSGTTLLIPVAVAARAFAILENVLKICELYRQRKRKRCGYRFPKGLPFRDFVFTHFDVWIRPVAPENEEKEVMFFHVRSIDDRARRIGALGGGDYWVIRRQLFSQDPWLN